MMSRVQALAVMAFTCSLFAGAAAAQVPDDKIPVYRLDVREVADIPRGKAALVSGKAGATPHRYFVENLYMLVPVSVTVRPGNPDAPVNVKILKGDWNKPLREAGTAGGKQVNFRFRTHGEFQIQVDSKVPDAPYKMVVWLGPDIQPQTAPIVVPASQFESGTASRWMWWVAGGAAALLAGFVVAWSRRKKSP